MKKTIYIASSWKNQHAVEMLTNLLRKQGHEVTSWIENNYGEGHSYDKKMNFEEWVNTDAADKSFIFDTHGAARCDLFIYMSPGGKDAAAECGIAYATSKRFVFGENMKEMIALYSKGEDFGLMRKMFSKWFSRYTDLLEYTKIK